MSTITLLQSMCLTLLKYLQREEPVLKYETLSVKEMERVNGCARLALDEQTKVSDGRRSATPAVVNATTGEAGYS